MANGHGAKRVMFIKDADGEITGCEIEGGSSEILKELKSIHTTILKQGQILLMLAQIMNSSTGSRAGR